MVQNRHGIVAVGKESTCSKIGSTETVKAPCIALDIIHLLSEGDIPKVIGLADLHRDGNVHPATCLRSLCNGTRDVQFERHGTGSFCTQRIRNGITSYFCSFIVVVLDIIQHPRCMGNIQITAERDHNVGNGCDTGDCSGLALFRIQI